MNMHFITLWPTLMLDLKLVPPIYSVPFFLVFFPFFNGGMGAFIIPPSGGYMGGLSFPSLMCKV
jgi:hypothetical protein